MKATRENHLDPLVSLRRLQKRLSIATAVVLGALSSWACWPLEPIQVGPPLKASQAEPSQLNRDEQSTVDRGVFVAAKLWNPPPPVIESVARPEPQPVVEWPRLRLIATIGEGAHYSAAVVREDSAELTIIRTGDRIDPFVVSEITGEGLILTHGDRRKHLLVRDARRKP